MICPLVSSAITSRCCTTSIGRPRTCAVSLGLPMARAEAVNDDPIFLDMMADVVLQTLGRYGARRALSLAMPTSEQPTSGGSGLPPSPSA